MTFLEALPAALTWTTTKPTVVGWYWIRYKDVPASNADMWFYDASEWDKSQMSERWWFCGPLSPPEHDE